MLPNLYLSPDQRYNTPIFNHNWNSFTFHKKWKKRYHFYAKITYMATIHLPVIFSHYCCPTKYCKYILIFNCGSPIDTFMYFLKNFPQHLFWWGSERHEPPPLMWQPPATTSWAPPSTFFFVWNGNVDTWILC